MMELERRAEDNYRKERITLERSEVDGSGKKRIRVETRRR